ncbi:MAG: hypothetical protein P8Y47_04840 [Alphaproteobacteria bacterium]
MSYVSRSPPYPDTAGVSDASQQAASYDAHSAAYSGAVNDEMLLLAAGVEPAAFASLQAQASHWGVPVREAALAKVMAGWYLWFFP